jgi:hypothetical protein
LIDSYLRDVNPYSSAYKHMHEVIEEQELNCLKDGIACKKISMYFKRDATEGPRRYNIPKIGTLIYNLSFINLSFIN